METRIKRKQKQITQRMAARMLGKEMIHIIMSWKILLLLANIFLFLVLPYIENEYSGQGGYYFILIMFLMIVYPIPEKIFFFLPMSEQQIRWYLSARCNLYSAAIVIISLGIAGIIQLTGRTPYMVNGIVGMLITLFSMEFLVYGGISEYWKKTEKHKFWNVVIVAFYSVSLFTILIIGIFFTCITEDGVTTQNYTSLIIIAVLFAIGRAIRFFTMKYTHFKEYRVLRRSYWDMRQLQKEEV